MTEEWQRRMLRKVLTTAREDSRARVEGRADMALEGQSTALFGLKRRQTDRSASVYKTSIKCHESADS